MNRSLLPAISAFCELAKIGSFTHAAEKLDISPSALSQSIRSLEKELDIRLLHRTTRSLSLTEEGQNFLKQVEPALKTIEYATKAASEVQSVPSGEIRINTSRVAARLLIEPYLKEFYQLYPNLHVELIMDDGIGDIVQEGCDAGIRLKESVLDTMIAIPISKDIQMAVVGSPEYFKKHLAPKSISDLKQHNCLRFRSVSKNSIYRWEFTDPQKPDGDVLFEPQGSFTTNDDESLIRAALEGIGLIMHFDLAVAQPIEEGKLVRVLSSWCPSWPGFQLYMQSRSQQPAKMRAFIDYFSVKGKSARSQKKKRKN